MIRRLFAGVGISTAIVLVTFIGQIVSVPVLLANWGDQMYGEWVTLTSLTGTFALLNLGVQTYVCNLLIECFTSGEIERGNRILSSALRLYFVLSGLVVVVTILIATQSKFVEMLNITAIPDSNARLIVLLEGGLIAYAILGGLLYTPLRASKQVSRQLTYGLAERIVFWVAPMLVALLRGAPVLSSIATISLMAVLSVVQLRDMIRRVPFTITPRLGTLREGLTVIPSSLMYLGVSFVSVATTSGVNLILAWQGGGNAVALYFTTITLTNFVRMIVLQGLNVLWPEITMAKLENPTALRQWFVFASKLLATLGGVMAIGISFFGLVVLRVWTRGAVQGDAVLNSVLAIYMAVQIFALIARTFGLATSQPLQVLRIELTGMGLTSLLAVWLTPLHSVQGLAVAFCLGQIVATGLMLRAAARWVDAAPGPLFSDLLGRGLPNHVLVLTGCATGAVLQNDPFAGTVTFGLLVLIYGVLSWALWLTQTERDMIRRLLFSRLGTARS